MTNTQEIQFQTFSPTPQTISSQDIFAERIRNKYKDYPGNCVNYLVNLALSYYDQDQDFSIYEITKNLESAIVEKVEADITGQHEYSLQTAINPIDGKSKIKFAQGWAEDVFDHAIDEKNSQLPLFEIQRNQANLKNLREIEKGINESEGFRFVELSPSPKITEEAKQRGYDGRDSVFVYTKKENGEVEVKQHWFNAVDISEYTALLDKLGIKRNIDGLQESDLTVMDSSFKVTSQEQLTLLDEFIDEKSIQGKQESIALLNEQMDYIFNSCSEKVYNYKDLGLRLLDNPDLDISVELEEISQFILNKQLELRYLLWEKGTNTFNEQVTRYIDEHKELNGSNFMNVLSNVYTATGCGFSYGSGKKAVLSSGQNIPKSTHLFNFTSPSPDRPDASICQTCNRVFFVKNGDSSTYFSNCPYCHNEIGRCE